MFLVRASIDIRIESNTARSHDNVVIADTTVKDMGKLNVCYFNSDLLRFLNDKAGDILRDAKHASQSHIM